MAAAPPLSLYIHVPWCVRKCPYCDFNSHEGDPPEPAYLNALLADLDQDLARFQLAGRPVETVFIGGGTPSLMSARFYRDLFAGLRERLPLADDAEITLEANPGTLEAGRFAGFREAGINRLSIGVQSFQPAHLQALGRIHGPDEARAAVREARAAGFDNFNLDLMHALPGQTTGQALDDLRAALALEPTHLSWYELTIEPNTAFYRAPPTQPDGDDRADTEEAGFALLAEAGFRRYEVSAFARPGRACRHNLNYWRFGDYLGIGAGAHGKLTLPDRRLRYQKTRLPAHYLADPATARRHETDIEAPLQEALLNGLRLLDGVSVDALAARSGETAATIQDALAPFRAQGLLVENVDQAACTALGLRHLDTVLERLFERLV
ncbi:radical SAM family heme chaperone HemW [Alloalcanivorax marinus]|uniref:radical SAM family heme chaperone HemW n=1 Tax=Alloalcanivorax marinus TaxID=1177169 RepID=UPI00195B09A7|nr:radical SAM family heme chaperone HemW [Alloalcanivorax marinus]MBM7334542.1 radical SAM family heme chaperone HemW [Alloalcanivorax marinus]